MATSGQEGPQTDLPDLHKDAARSIRDLIPTRPDIGFLRTDDGFVVRFLHARKFDIASTFRLFTRYFEYRQQNKNLFRKFNCHEPGVKSALLDGFPGVLPQRDYRGRRILVLFTANWDPYRYGLIAIYRALLLSLERLVEETETQANGFVIVIDWSGFTFRQSSHMNPRILKLMIEGLQDCFPGRFSGIHFINQPWYVEAALALIKPFLKDKTKQKLSMHGNNLTTLHSHISREVLPAELGGSGPPYNIDQWVNQLMSNGKLLEWPIEEYSSNSETKSTPRSETFPSCGRTGKPSVTELDEDFFLQD